MVRPQLLASYVRLADALEIAHARVEESEVSRFLFLQEVIADNADFTLFHWIKSFVVAAIAVLPKQHTFRVEFQIPEDDLEQVLGKDVLSSVPNLSSTSSIRQAIAEKSSRYRLLTQYALDELRNELETVEEILAANGPTSFHIVEPLETVRILRGAAKPPWSIGLRRVVNYLNVAYSPNSSGTASAALNAIDDAVSVICDRSDLPKYKLHEQAGTREDVGRIARDAVIEVIPHLRKSLQARLKQRRCHNELRRITRFVVDYAKALLDFDGDDFLQWIQALDGFRQIMGDILAPDGARMKSLRDRFMQIILDRHAHCTNQNSKLRVLLFGNSATVADSLATVVQDVRFGGLHCYIAEGRGKSKHGPHNKPIYLDAETYAATIHSSVDRIAPHIRGKERESRLVLQVIPDAAVGRVLDKNHSDERNGHTQVDAVLFGANGIFREPDIRVAHTCGHLSIAATAKYFNVPVYVMSSAAKIAEKPYSRWREAQRSPNEWIAGRSSDVVGRLKNVGASAAWNPQEEQVGSDLLDAIITDIGTCDCRLPGDDVKTLLKQWDEEITKLLEPTKSLQTLLADAE